MSDALYGLIGALGGAALGAAGAYWGPLRQQREVALQAAAERMYAERHEKIERLIAVRSSLRAWNALLNRTFLEMQIPGRSVDLDQFRQDELNAMNEGWRALDAVMHDHVVVSAAIQRHLLANETFRPSMLTEALEQFGLRLSQVGQDGLPMSAEALEELEALSQRAANWRRDLSAVIESRLEEYFLGSHSPGSAST
ncbi:hypothetical protein [Streptomyces sp. NPDC017529]|uniref:hypothetical protein n=1 Tax=Streptomyces sp. NPDC017529 TaxID=3365000 RepID=UPI0037912BC3